MTDISLDRAESQLAAIWRQFRQHKGAVFGLCVLVFLVAFVLLGPYLGQAEALKASAVVTVKIKPPSLRFPLGTDQLGRDMLDRMISAGRVS